MIMKWPVEVSPPSTPLSHPVIAFHGPDKLSQIHAVDGSSGCEVARFALQGTKGSSWSIYRIPHDHNSAQPSLICNAEKSMFGDLKLLVHGQEEIRVKGTTDDNLKEVFAIKTASFGTLKWRSSSSGNMELKDSGRVVVARGSMRDSKLEVYVHAQALIMDIWLSSWVAAMKAKKASDDEAEVASEIIQAVAGG
ncbi:hypothetical protein LTR56_005954 [Elasticomyces elasticus]|nr:hypothetical protein LTR56_005954 [Elasticomyces elasticus]KAK3669086.1 hypothetical protein LTR22_000165 [Elasticomyces elasticus]KAK4920967.1 hypothetical protein LTR49_011511 [Elasticomyces elasticus]KAK5759528.1 hypothetical protein LTS12_010386 [Elasticomyces elasticus]